MALPQRREPEGDDALQHPEPARQGTSRNRQDNQQVQNKQSGKSGTGHVFVAASIAALGGLLFGYDTGVISGAELYLKKDFALNSTTEEIAVSAVLVGAILGAAICGKLSDAIGRKLTILTMAVIFTVGAILTAFSPSVWVFVAFRIIVGIGIGMASVVTPIYISEMAPSDKRGGMVTLNQLAVTAGIAVAYWVDLAFAAANMGWRPMFAVAAVPSTILFIGMLFLSDTPRWLGSKGKWDKAKEVLNKYVGEQTDQELNQLHKNLEETGKSSARDLFRKGYAWR